MENMFGDDDEGKSKGDLVSLEKRHSLQCVHRGGAHHIAPLMGVYIDGFCTTTDDDDTCTDNALFSSEEVTELIGVAPNGIRIGGAVIVAVSFAIKGMQYRFVPQKNSDGFDH